MGTAQGDLRRNMYVEGEDDDFRITRVPLPRFALPQTEEENTLLLLNLKRSNGLLIPEIIRCTSYRREGETMVSAMVDILRFLTRIMPGQAIQTSTYQSRIDSMPGPSTTTQSTQGRGSPLTSLGLQLTSSCCNPSRAPER